MAGMWDKFCTDKDWQKNLDDLSMTDLQCYVLIAREEMPHTWQKVNALLKLSLVPWREEYLDRDGHLLSQAEVQQIILRERAYETYVWR